VSLRARSCELAGKLEGNSPSVRRTFLSPGHPSVLASNRIVQVPRLSQHTTQVRLRNPTFHPTYQSDATGSVRHHRTKESRIPGPNRRHRTSPTVCSHLIIPRSWVRSPPALLQNSGTSSVTALGLRSFIHAWMGGAHSGRLTRQNGCPAGSENTRSLSVSFFAPNSIT
jgi:hypothetical protein